MAQVKLRVVIIFKHIEINKNFRQSVSKKLHIDRGGEENKPSTFRSRDQRRQIVFHQILPKLLKYIIRSIFTY